MRGVTADPIHRPFRPSLTAVLLGLLGRIFAPQRASRSHATAIWHAGMTARVHVLPEEMREVFRRQGYNHRRPFFPHQLRFLPKAGPDAFRLASRMCGIRDPDALWQITLVAEPPALEGLPPELFFDDDVVWHQQHFGRPGHVGWAGAAVRGRRLYGLGYTGDVVQRIGRRRAYKTRVEHRLRGWPMLLLHAMLWFAARRGLVTMYCPTADWMLRHTDPARSVGRELYDRIYDRAVLAAAHARRSGRWWVIDVAANQDRIHQPVEHAERLPGGPTICVCHDVERGWGHLDVDPAFAARAEANAPAALEAMLDVERGAGVRTTYHVLGCFMHEVRAQIARDGHALAFHSYDHDLRTVQLERCRRVDYRLPGYRAPRSHLTRELRESNLCHHNFTWLAASAHALGATVPRLERRIVKIPILLDDYALHTGDMDYARWEATVLDLAQRRAFVAIGLHDCYAQHWLPHYARLLARLKELGTLRTFDAVVDDLFLAAAD